MNFLKNFLSPRPSNQGTFHIFTVKCKRCGEIIQGQVNLNNEPSREYDENGKPYFICRKVLVGNGLCFQRIEAIFKFNEQRGLLDHQITGGDFIDD